jgi:hypothetical protein
MFRIATLATVLAALALPAAAQQATPSGKIDWSKPVVGVDANVVQARGEDTPLPVEVFTLDLKKAPEAEPQKQQTSPPCDPARKPSADGKSEVLSVCPAEPPANAQ